jgi:hypothetical protein
MLELEKAWCLSTRQITAWFEKTGFVKCSSRIDHHITLNESARDYLDRGILTRDSTSKLSLMSTEEYAAGMERIRRSVQKAATRSEDQALRRSLYLRNVWDSDCLINFEDVQERVLLY